MQTPAAKTRMTSAEFAQLPETSQFIELIEGELVVSPTPVAKHQRMAFILAQFLSILVPDGEVFISPLEVHFDELNVLEPDVFWISDKNDHCTLGENGYWYGAPDLVVEVLSPSTAKLDHTHKFNLYEQFGVIEYWIADPTHGLIEGWTLQNMKFVRAGIFGAGDVYQSPVLGLRELPHLPSSN